MDLEPFSVTALSWLPTLTNVKMGYMADRDLDNYDNIAKAKVLVIIGHSEYWTREARMNFDRFVDSGRDAMVLSGNTMWWHVRYKNDQLICFKNDPDTVIDPLDKTVLWTAPSLEYPIIKSIGADFDGGGYGQKADEGWDGYKIVLPSSPLLEGTGLQTGDILSVPTVEYDGAPVTGFAEDGTPVLDYDKLRFHKIELIGFDKGFRGSAGTVSTFIVFKKTTTSGVVINVSSTNWCSPTGMGGKSGNKVKQITTNAITKLLAKQTVFANP
jgi:hypothetical protein